MAKTPRFRAIIAELHRLNAAREAAIMEAFDALEEQEPDLVAMVLQHVGERGRAARWMSTQRQVFGGRSAYEALAAGETEQVWDRLLDNEGGESVPRPAAARMVY